MKKTPADRKKTGSSFHWLPDLDVFTDIDIPKEYYEDTLKRQAVVNAGITFRFRCESAPGKFDETEYFYENGILDYIREITQDQSLTAPQFWEAERKGRDRSDMDEYKVKISAAFCFFQSGQPAGVLPQLVLAGIWRRAGEGGQKRLCLRHRRLSEIHQQIYEDRIQNYVPGCGRLSGAGDELLLHEDLLRKPDQKGNHQQVCTGRHDRVLPRPAARVFHREQAGSGPHCRAGADQQAAARRQKSSG